MIVKPSTIRIWIHDKDLGRLQKVLWEGLGDRLKTETSTNPVVRRFLNAVPYIMGSIREIHSAAINNDLELLKSRSQDPVPKDILLSRDINGLTPLHKAAGLGHIKIAKEILKKAPEAANVKDFYDRTPLHYAAALKDKGEMFQLLADNGSIDHLEDKKGNTPTYYRGKPAELDGPKLLNVIPDAPRTAHIFPPSWDWRLLGGKDPEQPDSASPLLSPMVRETSQTDDDRTATENDDTTAKDTEEEQTVSASQEEEPEEEVVSPRPDISEDEGVGSEVPVSEEYEENQESRLVDSLFADLGVNGEIISDSGNEEEGTREEGDQEVKDEDTEAIVNMKAEEEGDNEQTDIAKDDLDTGNNDLSVQDALEEIADYENADIAKNDLDTSNTEQQKNDAEHFGVEINSEEETAQSSEYITLNNTIQTSYSLERQKTADSKSVENVENDEKTDELDDKNETSKTSEAIVNESRNSTAEDNISKSEENVEIQLNTEEEDKYKTEEEVENEAERLSSTSSKELVPIRSLSRGVEILSITPADPDEVDDEDLQEAVARGTPGGSGIIIISL
ncbi:hypothetical protein O3M35_012301 [Rhynocoris fuscipes]|uniref:Uncharacterized protein n=1 Tax=Rhynocoris fuscipes TaxID=488301 RepID=A0AAW1CUF1_9HEMI